MKKINFKSSFLLVSLLLVIALSVGAAYAYFSDYDQLVGKAKVTLSGQSEIEETPEDNKKTIAIKNTGVEGKNSSCIAKVLIYGPDGMTVTPDAPEDWTQIQTEDGVFAYYYNGVLAPGESTSKIVASIANIDKDDAANSDVEIIVLQESQLFSVDEDGYVVPESWTDFPKIKA